MPGNPGFDPASVPVPSITGNCHSKAKAKVDLETAEEQFEAAWRRQAQKEFMVFVRGLSIDSQSGPRVFENCMALFQRQCFEDMAPSIERLRAGKMPPVKRWWIERTKKASKDADLAVIVLWLVAFPLRPFYCQIGAANLEQAGIVKERVANLLHHNPWLNDYVEMVDGTIKSRKLKSNGKDPLAKAVVLASGSEGKHGGTPDLLVINELSHITKFTFAETLMDNADGVAQGMVIVATNAGFKGTPAEVWRMNALKNPDVWRMHVLDEPAPWHNQATLKDARRRNSPSRYARLWRGRWVSGKGDALNEETIEKIFTLPGPTLAPKKGLVYLGGMDLGVSNDHSGLVVVGVDYERQKVSLAYMERFRPLEGPGEVDLMLVEEKCKMMSKIFKVYAIFYDPHQAKLMAQRLTRVGVPMREMLFQGTNLTLMATSLVSLANAGKLECFDDEDGTLRSDFGKFNVVEKSYGYKLEAVSDEMGHADVGTALAMTLPCAMDMLDHNLQMGAGDDLCHLDDEPLSPEEEADMPEELRAIYSSEADVPNHRSRAKQLEQMSPLADIE